MTIDRVALARWNLAYAEGCLEQSTDPRERRLIRQNIAQIKAYLKTNAEAAS